MVSGEESTRCPKCHCETANKLVSRFARYRNEDDRIDEIADRLELMGEPQSATEMREVVRDLGKAMDEDVSDEIEEMFEADMAGELDDDI
jgi:hypothetical protein